MLVTIIAKPRLFIRLSVTQESGLDATTAVQGSLVNVCGKQSCCMFIDWHSSLASPHPFARLFSVVVQFLPTTARGVILVHRGGNGALNLYL